MPGWHRPGNGIFMSASGVLSGLRLDVNRYMRSKTRPLATNLIFRLATGSQPPIPFVRPSQFQALNQPHSQKPVGEEKALTAASLSQELRPDTQPPPYSVRLNNGTAAASVTTAKIVR